LRDQLKGATSPALADSAAGELTRVEIKNREKIEKSVDPSLASLLEAAFHIQNSIHFITIHEKEIHFAIRIL
jgi:hypothetical protein